MHGKSEARLDSDTRQQGSAKLARQIRLEFKRSPCQNPKNQDVTPATFSFAFKAPSYSVNTQPHEWTLVTLARWLAPRNTSTADSGASEVPCFFSSESRCTKQGRPPMTECSCELGIPAVVANEYERHPLGRPICPLFWGRYFGLRFVGHRLCLHSLLVLARPNASVCCAVPQSEERAAGHGVSQHAVVIFLLFLPVPTAGEPGEGSTRNLCHCSQKQRDEAVRPPLQSGAGPR